MKFNRNQLKNNNRPALLAAMLIFALSLSAGKCYSQTLESDDLEMKSIAAHPDNDPHKALCVADSILIVQKAQARTEQMGKYLNLTEEQVQAVQKSNFDYFCQLFRLNSSALSEQQHEEKLNGIESARLNALNTVLSGTQREKLKTNPY